MPSKFGSYTEIIQMNRFTWMNQILQSYKSQANRAIKLQV